MILLTFILFLTGCGDLDNQQPRDFYPAPQPIQTLRLLGKTVPITRQIKGEDLQGVIDRRGAEAVSVSDEPYRGDSRIWIAGHKEGQLGEVAKLHPGDSVSLKNELGIAVNYTVKDAKLLTLKSIGNQGVVTSSRKNAWLTKILQKKDALILQTCTRVFDGGYEVKIVVLESEM